MRKFLVTLASVTTLLLTFAATAYADGEDGLYKNKSDCTREAMMETSAGGGEPRYFCERVERTQEYGKGDCRPPRATSTSGCIGYFWELKDEGGDGPHLPEEPSRTG
jgi:hypothetical protein